MSTLDEIIESRGETWAPTFDRFGNPWSACESALTVEPSVLAQLRESYEYQKQELKPPEKTRPPMAWDRLLWDEPWEKPTARPPKSPSKAPVVLVHAFDALEGIPPTVTDSASSYAWLLLMGQALHTYVAEKTRFVDGRADRSNSSLEFEEAWEQFSEACALTFCSPSQSRSRLEYIMDVRDASRAAVEIRPLWFGFLDTTVLHFQSSLRLRFPPVFVFLFLNFQFEPGAAAVVSRALRKTGHSRLLCLFTDSD